MKARPMLVAVLAALTTAAAAQARPQGDWDPVSSGEQSPISQIGVDRADDGILHVAWQRRSGPNSYDLLHTAIDSSGRVRPARPVVTGWVGIGDVTLATRFAQIPDPRLITAGPQVTVSFAGQRSTDTSDPLIGLLIANSTDAGATWSSPSILYRDSYVHGRTPSALVAGGSVYFGAWYRIGETVVLRSSLSGPGGGQTYDYLAGGSSRCCAYQQNIATDRTSIVVAWCSGIDAPNGIWAQRVDGSSGAPLGSASLLPGSATLVGGRPTRACDAHGRVPLVGRPVGGIFAAGSVGYPSATQVRLWRFGAGFAVVAAGAGEKRTVALAAAPDGRLWVAWSQRGSNRLFFRRSNRAVTRLGEVVGVRQPGGTLEASGLNLAAQADRLDVLGRFALLPVGARLYHSQVYPGLTLRATGGPVARFRVTDAGDPVPSATIRVGGRTLTTDGAGRASVDLPRGTYTATASRLNYTSASARVRTR